MKRLVWLGVIAALAGAVYLALRETPVAVEMTTPSVITVREFIAEDAKTRLADEYIIDTPILGTVGRIRLEIGDSVKAGEVVVTIDTYSIEQRAHEVESLIAQAEAHVSGVDIEKPKPEDIESARIRIREMGDALEIARKVRRITEFNEEEARRDFERANSLLKDGAVSASYFDDVQVRAKGLKEDLARLAIEEEAAKKALDLSKLALQRLTASIDDNEYMRVAYLAQIDGLNAQLAVLGNDVKKAQVRSPVSGVVIEKFIEDERFLLAGTPLLKVGDFNSLEIECDVLSEEIGRVRVGNAVEISGKALLGDMIMGEIERIYPAGFMKVSALGVEQQRVRTIIAFDNSEIKLRPGTSIDAKIVTAESPDVMAIPDRACIRREGEWYVFRVEGGRGNLTPITLGLRNNDWAEIRDGLQPGDTIIAEPKNELEDGALVKALE